MAKFEAELAAEVREVLYLIVAGNTALLFDPHSSEVVQGLAKSQNFVEV
jgi:hypothetical protein